MADLEIGCRCGQFEAVLTDVSPKTGSHVQCYCKDCQAGAHALGAQDTLMPRGGTDIYQSTPAHIQLIKGREHLACLRLSPKGLMRWYTSCCDTPVFNTLGHTKLAFIGVSVAALKGENLDKAIGKVIAVVHTKDAANGPERIKDFGFNRAGFNVLARHVGAMISGQSRVTPLFDENSAPIVAPRVLSKEERRAATP